MPEKNFDVERLRQASREKGRNFFVRDYANKDFRIPSFGDVLDPYNSAFLGGIEDGVIEVVRDENNEPKEVVLTEKYFAEKGRAIREGRQAVKQHRKKQGEKYYGRRRANPEAVAMDKEENFEKFLNDWLRNEKSVKGWIVSALKQKKRYSLEPTQYRLEVEFEDNKKTKIYIGDAESIVNKINKKLDDFYPQIPEEYV